MASERFDETISKSDIEQNKRPTRSSQRTNKERLIQTIHFSQEPGTSKEHKDVRSSSSSSEDEESKVPKATKFPPAPH